MCVCSDEGVCVIDKGSVCVCSDEEAVCVCAVMEKGCVCACTHAHVHRLQASVNGFWGRAGHPPCHAHTYTHSRAGSRLNTAALGLDYRIQQPQGTGEREWLILSRRGGGGELVAGGAVIRPQGRVQAAWG